MKQQESAPAWDIWGNQPAVERMQRAVRTGPRHAYVLSGTSSIGKSLLATSFAAALLCPDASRTGMGCGSCSTCRRVFKGIHPDVARFDLASQAARDESKSKNMSLNIATVRDVGRHVALRPMEAAWRVVIVDDVETMQETAQEAFLKTLEEPPSYVVIVLLTSDAELLLPTILSRCSVITMTPVHDAVIESALVARGAAPGVATALAVASRGKVGLALSALDDDDVRSELLDSVKRVAAWIAGDEYHRIVASFRLADRFSESREIVFNELLAAEIAWRELLRDAADVGQSSSHPVLASCQLSTLNDGYQALAAIDRCLRDLDANVRPRAALETMVLRWPAVVHGAGS